MTSPADDLEALFDEVAAHRTGGAAEAASPPGAAPIEQTANAATPLNQADKPMFERLGGIVRLLHDSLRELGYDRSLSNVATQISDAQGRLEYIASLTEQAANKVLNAIDVGMPEQEAVGKNAQNIEDRWTALFEGRLSVDEFKQLAGDSRQFAAKVAASTDAEKARLLEIMMAQDFQDITGQLIKKIVAITHTVETELAQLLRDNAPPEAKAAMAAAETKSPELMQGPSAPDTALVQDDVDSLLADLGF